MRTMLVTPFVGDGTGSDKYRPKTEETRSGFDYHVMDMRDDSRLGGGDCIVFYPDLPPAKRAEWLADPEIELFNRGRERARLSQNKQAELNRWVDLHGEGE